MPLKPPAGQQKTLLIILGPTAVGKTRLAIMLADYFNTEIVSADSRQFYREMKIGTAVPSEEELATVKHHLIGNLSVKDDYNVSRFEQEALEILGNIFKQKDIALMAGGSGLYINAVCKGIDEIPDPDADLREELNATFEQKGIEPLREQLRLLDPECYARTDIANHKRIIRALEVCIASGKPYSSYLMSRAKPRDFQIVKLGLKRGREELYAMINQRVDLMMEAGLEQEARALLPCRGFNSLNTVGYRELFGFFDGKCTLVEAVEKIKVNTRRYAKKQMTWFERDKEIEWMNASEADKIMELVKIKVR